MADFLHHVDGLVAVIGREKACALVVQVAGALSPKFSTGVVDCHGAEGEVVDVDSLS